MSYYPVFLDIEGKRCVVVGGGTVAHRKVIMLLGHAGDVEVISPKLCPELKELVSDGSIKAVRRAYRTGDLDGAVVVIAATDDRETNERVAQEAREKRVLVNVVDTPDLCDFIVPSYVRRGDVTVAVSTNGKSPALARKIRKEIEKHFGAEYGALASLLEEVRGELRDQQIRIPPDAWQQALDLDQLIHLLRMGMRDAAKKHIVDTLAGKFT